MNHEQAVKLFLQNLDDDMLAQILSPDQIYMNKSIEDFLENLSVCFVKFHSAGDKQLVITDGRCKHVESGSYTFVGESSKDFIELLINSKDGIVSGIQECYCHKSDSGIPGLRTRLYVDPSKGSPF